MTTSTISTVEAAAEIYLTHLRQTGRHAHFDARLALTLFCQAFGTWDIRDLRPSHSVRWILDLAQRRRPDGRIRWSTRTLHKHWSLVRATFSHAVALGALEVNPIQNLPRGLLPPPVDTDRTGDVLSPHEMLRLVSSPAILEWRRALWALFLATGVRVGEGLALRFSDIHTAFPLYRLEVSRSFSCKARCFSATKTKTVRQIPVHPVLQAFLHRLPVLWLEHFGTRPQRDDLLFPRKTQKGFEPQYQPQVLAAWKRDLTALHLRPRRLHATRATFITQAIAHGASESAILSMTHADRSVVARYRLWAAAWPSYCVAVEKLPLERLEAPRQLELLP